MGETPIGIIPDELFTPGATAGVMQFLSRMWIDGETKAKLFRLWASEVGVRLSASQVNRVRDTGIDAGGPPR
jgi:hypothetical protein